MSNPLTPNCCEKARKTFAVRLQHTYDQVIDGASSDEPPEWLISLPDNLNLYHESEDRIVKFCPYCGTELPTIRRKPVPPKSVCVVTDGGYYCDSCEERLSACECEPAASVWEIIDEE